MWWKSKPAEDHKPLTLGQQGELWGQEEYKKLGWKIVAKNEYHHKGKRLGEIDFIATKKNHITFVEVKTRTAGSNRFGTGAESVDTFKQIKILKAVKMYLLKHKEFTKFIPQIDVCNIIVTNLDKEQYSATILPSVVDDWN